MAADTAASRELNREVDRARATAASLQREEDAGRLPRGGAEDFRRQVAAAIKTARQQVATASRA